MPWRNSLFQHFPHNSNMDFPLAIINWTTKLMSCRSICFIWFKVMYLAWNLWVSDLQMIHGCFIRLRHFHDKRYGGDRHARCLIALPSNLHQWIYGWIEWLSLFRHISKQIPHSCIAGSLHSEIPWPRVYRQIGSVMIQSASCMNVTIASPFLDINMQILPNSQRNQQTIIII